MNTASRILGLPIPSSDPTFLAILGVHIAAGLFFVVAGAVAVTARKRAGRHTRTGLMYWWSLAIVFATLTALSIIRWAEDHHLFFIGVVAFGAATVGYLARKRRWRGWLSIHIAGMGISYIALLTGFYVDNGPNLPGWKHLPHLVHWTLPAVLGIPLILRALARPPPG